MRLVLDPAEDAAHGDWLRQKPGAYEWWYFDALSDDGRWALTCIWFLGNPFSPFYRLAALGRPADPFAHNALFFALYEHGALHAYHFSRFPPAQVEADETRPATLRFGPSRLAMPGPGCYQLTLADENANRRGLDAELTFSSAPLPPVKAEGPAPDDAHCWLPAAPSCRVGGRITLTSAQNPAPERITFEGHGYHDHNWGRLPFEADLRDWYWARAGLGEGRAAVVYHTRYRGQRAAVSHLLLFDHGRLVRHDPAAYVSLSRPRVNGFGIGYATRLVAESGDLSAEFRLGARLDSAPFYVRTLCRATLSDGQAGEGMGEYFRPRVLSWPLVASAMKARILEVGC